MNCKKCGAQIPDGAKFCPQCGTDNSSFSVNIDFSADAKNGVQFDGTVEENGKVRKISKKKGILGIVICAVIVAAVLVLINFSAIENFARKTFTSPSKYYAWVEQKYLGESVDDLADAYADYLIWSYTNASKSKGTGEISFKIEEAGKDLLSAAALSGVDLEWLDSGKIKYTVAMTDEALSLDLGLGINGLDILSLDALIAGGDRDGAAYARIPELSPMYLGFDLGFDPLENIFSGSLSFTSPFGSRVPYNDARPANMFTGMKISDLETIGKSLPSKETLKKIVKRYIRVALKQISGVKKSSKTLKAEGISERCTVLKVKVDSDTLIDIFEAWAKEIEKDKELKSVIEKVLKGLESTEIGAGIEDADADEILEELSDKLTEAADDIEKYPDYFISDEIEMAVYVDAKGKVRGRECTLGYEEIQIYTPHKGNKIGVEIVLDDLTITGKGKDNGGKITGEFSINVNENECVVINLTNFNTNTVLAGRLKGKAELSIGEDLVKTLQRNGMGSESVNVARMFDGYNLVFDFDTAPKSGTVKMELKNRKNSIVSMKTTFSRGNTGEIEMPADSKVVDIDTEAPMEGLSEWFDSFDTDKLVDKIEKLDLDSTVETVIVTLLEKPQQILSILPHIFGGGRVY